MEPQPPPQPVQEQKLASVVQKLEQRVAPVEKPAESRFSVEVNNPNTWLDTFKQVQQGELPRRGFTLGKVETNDQVSSSVSCAVQVLGGEKDDKVSYSLDAQINYSDDRLQKDGGFNTTGEAVKIAKVLREQGAKVKFATTYDGQQMMILEKDGVNCQVNLGWATVKERPKDLTPPSSFSRWRFDEPKLGRMQKEDSDSLPPVEPPLKNEPIHFLLADSTKSTTVIEVSSPEDIAKQTTVFSDMLGKFINAYYQVRETIPGDVNLNLQIPDWESYKSDDTSIVPTGNMSDKLSGFMKGFLGRSEDQDIGYLLTEQEKATMPTFAEIGGQPQAVEEARKLVMSIKNAEVFAKRGVDRPKGILLKGPPGTGKTMLAKAIAREAGAEFMSLSVTDLVSKWFGEAEKKVQGFFDRAKEITDKGKDVIVFVDELDSVVPSRDGAHEATQKMVAVFLQNMDGLKSNPHLTMLAATNQADKIDPAFLRPGRLDKKIEVGIPDASGRAQILGIHLKRHLQRAAEPTTLIDPQLKLSEIATTLGNVSGADIAAVVNFALEEKTAAEISFLESDSKTGRAWTPLSAEDLIKARDVYMPQPKTREQKRMGFAVPPPKA